MNKVYFGSNLKMYKNIAETISYLQELQHKTADLSREELSLFIIPSYTSLPSSVNAIKQQDIWIGAQNMCWEEQGQFTGEISPIMLKEIGIDLVMIGHSERRHVFNETDYVENKKVISSLAHGFKTLLCVGETEIQKEYGISKEILREQLQIGFHGVTSANTSKILVAYEPVWSIGVNGKPAEAGYAEKMHETIKACLHEIFGKEGLQIPVLYGGSVNLKNCNSFITQPSIDGLFVGRAAWNADQFNILIRQALKALKEKDHLQ